MNKPYAKLEMAANIAIIVVAIMIGFVVVRNYLYKPASMKPSAPAAGTKLSLPDVYWANSNKTLVIALQEGCGYCSESAPFYQRLVTEASSRNVPLIAVLPQPVEVGKKYLSDLKVSINEVRESPLKSLGVQATPTLLLVNNKGEVTEAWLGKLSPEKESEVLEKLQ